MGAKRAAKGCSVRTFYVRTDHMSDRVRDRDFEGESVSEEDVCVHSLF